MSDLSGHVVLVTGGNSGTNPDKNTAALEHRRAAVQPARVESAIVDISDEDGVAAGSEALRCR